MNAATGLATLKARRRKVWSNAMEIPVELDFQGVEGKLELREAIGRQIAQLEERFGRLTKGRIVVKGPGAHHSTGGLYEINIRLALPGGREVNVARTPQADERHADLNYALNDAFKRARRQLQDHVARMQGRVKQHEP
jgi:ribosome-associated translation inhibitor RaiA